MIKKKSPVSQIHIQAVCSEHYTLSRWSEISKKNLRLKLKTHFDTPFRMQKHAENLIKIVGVFFEGSYRYASALPAI